MWYQHGVRIVSMFAVAAFAVLGCGGGTSSPSSVTSVPSATPAAVDPVRIDRARGALPEGYEVGDIAGRLAPFAQWGFGEGRTAEPVQCAVLADPVPDAATSHGWSASGPGGIVYAAVVGSPPQPARLDPAVLADCATWTLSGGRTAGSVAASAGPAVDAAETVTMSIAATTVVEGGTETHAHAETVTAYLDDYVVVVTVVTDPGSPNPQLGQDFATRLMTTSVAELRG